MSEKNSAQNLPLQDVRVLDLTTTYFGPLTTQLIGDFGADIIKIESPIGDPIRFIGPSRTDTLSAVFHVSGRNKRSIVLDLKSEVAREALWRLVDTADMFVHNMRPAKIAALGFSPEAVLARRPGIVYGGLHGYRASGPYANRPAYDDVIQGESGVADLYTRRDGEPALVPSSFVDKSTALMAANGLLAAYIKRLRTGKGVSMECSMFEGMVGYNLTEHQYGTIFDNPEGEPGYPRVLTPHRKPQKTRDGYMCMLAYTDKQWHSFWHAVGRPMLASDERFMTMQMRSQHFGELYKTAGEILADRTTEEWLTLFDEVQVPAGRVNSLSDLRDDPQLKATGFFRKFEHPHDGLLHMPDTGYQIDGESLPIRHGAPKLGEHGKEVLSEVGLTDAQIDEVLAPK